MRILFAALFFSFFFSASPLYAEARAGCEHFTTKIKISNNAVYERLRYDYTKTVDQLTAMAKKGGATGTQNRHAVVFGLFTGGINFSYQFAGQFLNFPDKTSCLKSVELTIVFNFADPTVHVAREFKKGTAEFHRVHRHEMRHAAINIENYKRYFAYLQPEMTKYVSSLKLKKGTQNQLQKELLGKITSFLNPRIKIMVKNIQKFNDDFDAQDAKETGWLANYYIKQKGLKNVRPAR